jgi:hypothetical protein
MIGKPAWGLKRTYGSMFFLEIGAPVVHAWTGSRRGEQNQIHGEWCFLIEMGAWRFDSPSGPLVGCESAQDYIDQIFDNTDLGLAVEVVMSVPANDLLIKFSSGCLLRTFSLVAGGSGDWTDWLLFEPDGYVWSSEAGGQLLHRHKDAAPV